MATQEQLDAFNAAVASGDYAGAASMAASAGYSPQDVASYVNQNLGALNLAGPVTEDVVSSFMPSPRGDATKDIVKDVTSIVSPNFVENIFTQTLGRDPTAQELESYRGITDEKAVKQGILKTEEPLKIFNELLDFGMQSNDPDFFVAAKRYAKDFGFDDAAITKYINEKYFPETEKGGRVTEEEVRNVLLPEEVRDALESQNLTQDQFEVLSRYFGNPMLIAESRVAAPDRFNAPTVAAFVNRGKSGYDFASFAATRGSQFGGGENIQDRFNKLGSLTAPYIGLPVGQITTEEERGEEGNLLSQRYFFTKPDGKQVYLSPTENPNEFKEVVDDQTVDGTTRYSLGIKYKLDPSTNQLTIQGPDLGFYTPQKSNFVRDVAPLVTLAAMPFAPQLGSYLYGLSGAAAAAAGAATISAGTQLAAEGKVDPLRAALSAGTAYVGYDTGLTGADIASDAAQLAQQGLDASQIAATIASTGVNEITARVAAELAIANVPAAVAPLITAGSINMAMAGLNAVATGRDVGDSMMLGALTGAGSELSNTIIDDMIGKENVQAIAQSTGLTPNQVRNVGVASISEALSAEINNSGDFSKTLGKSLVANGMSFAAANQVVKSFDENVSTKQRAAIVSAVQESTNIATRAAIDGRDIGQVLSDAAPFIMVKAGVSAIKAPGDKKVVQGEQTISTPKGEQTIAVEKTTQIADGSGFKTPEEAMEWAKSQGANQVSWGGKVYEESKTGTKAPSVTGIVDGSSFSSAEDAIKWANSMGENRVTWQGQVYQNKTLTERFGEIDSAKNFGEAYSKARDVLGPGAIFEWNGNRYTTDTKEESLSRTNAQEKIQNVEASKEVANTIAKDASKINLSNDKDTGGVFEYINQKFFNNAFTVDNIKDTPVIGTVVKTIAAQQGLGLDAVGEQIKDFATTYSLTTGSSFDNSLKAVGNTLIEMGKGLGSEEYNEKIQSAGQRYNELANTRREDGLGKSLWQRTSDFVTVAKENPQGAFGFLFTEVAQEAIPLGAGMTVVLTAPASMPLAGTMILATTVGATVSATIDAAEVYGDIGQKEYDYERSIGKTDEQARAIANQRAATASMITLVTEGVADKTILDTWSSGLARGAPGILSTGTKVVAANYFSEYVENWGHNLSIAMSRGEELTPDRLNQIASEAQLEAIIGGKTAATLISPTIANQAVIAVAEDGTKISFDQLVSGENKPISSINFSSPVNVLPNGDQLTLGGVTQLLQSSDAGIELSPDPASVVYVKADGTAVTSGQVADLSTQFNASIPDVFKYLSNNQIDTSALDVRLDSSTVTGPGTEVTTTTTINPDTGNTVNTETETDTSTGSTTETSTETDQSTGTVTDTTVVTDANTSTNVTVTTDTNTNTTTTTATQTNTNTNTTTDITTKVQTELDEIVSSLVDQGFPPTEAVKLAVKEVTQKTSGASSSGASRSGFGMAPALMMPMLAGADSDFEHPSLFTRGPIEGFKSPLEEFFQKIEAAEEIQQAETSPQPKEEQMDTSDYFAYGQERDIDSILSGDIVSGIFDSTDNFNFPAMKKGGLVPAFKDGGLLNSAALSGPLTIAAGKVRRDYRQGDAVIGPGDGQSDDIPAMLADGEFVIPADVVAALGNGSNKAGADKLYDMMHNIRREHRKGKPQDLPKPAKSPLQYIKRRA